MNRNHSAAGKNFLETQKKKKKKKSVARHPYTEQIKNPNNNK